MSKAQNPNHRREDPSYLETFPGSGMEEKLWMKRAIQHKQTSSGNRDEAAE